jgi:hypothetical protein
MTFRQFPPHRRQAPQVFVERQLVPWTTANLLPPNPRSLDLELDAQNSRNSIPTVICPDVPQHIARSVTALLVDREPNVATFDRA